MPSCGCQVQAPAGGAGQGFCGEPLPHCVSPCQLSLKPGSQTLRSGNWSERKSHRLPRLPKRHSHDDMLLLAQLSLPSSPSSLNEDSLSTTSELLSSRRARRIPKVASPEGLGGRAGRRSFLPSFLPLIWDCSLSSPCIYSGSMPFFFIWLILFSYQ